MASIAFEMPAAFYPVEYILRAARNNKFSRLFGD